MEMAPIAKSTVSMMGADAKAGVYFFPKARTIIDVGAEEARAVKCDEKGVMVDFIVNERCAAGAGAFIEAMARALEVKLEEMGPLSLKAERASLSINASCVIILREYAKIIKRQRKPLERQLRSIPIMPMLTIRRVYCFLSLGTTIRGQRRPLRR